MISLEAGEEIDDMGRTWSGNDNIDTDPLAPQVH